MNRIEVERLTTELLSGRLSQADFVSALAVAPTAELGDVTLDLDRQRRCGFPEVVFGESNTVETLVRVFRRLLDERQPVLATRIAADKAPDLLQNFPTGRYNSVARTFRIEVGPICRMGPGAANQANLAKQGSAR